MELYEEETSTEVYKLGIHTLPEFEPRDTPEQMMSELYDYTKGLLESDKFLCMLGGEHSVSAPIIAAHNEKYDNLSVLQIDAHADLRDSYDGTPHSHASIMARVVKDLRIPSVQVGIRSISGDEARDLKNEDLPTTIYWARDIVGRTDWIDEAVDSLTENVYLTIDIDGLDPSLVPTTGTPEPGGLGWYETLTLIRKLAESKRIVGMDLVKLAHRNVINRFPRLTAVVTHAAADAQIVVMPVEAQAFHAQRNHVAPADDDQRHGRDPIAVAAVKGGLHRRAGRQADVP